MISRRDFTKGLVTGAAAMLGLNVGINMLQGKYNHLFTVRDGLSAKLIPKHHDEMKVMLLGTGIPSSGVARSKSQHFQWITASSNRPSDTALSTRVKSL